MSTSSVVIAWLNSPGSKLAEPIGPRAAPIWELAGSASCTPLRPQASGLAQPEPSVLIGASGISREPA